MNPKVVSFYNRRLKKAAFGLCSEVKYNYLCTQHEERYRKRSKPKYGSWISLLADLDPEQLPDCSGVSMGDEPFITPDQVVMKCREVGMKVPKGLNKAYYWR